ncbi:MAG: sulfite exporter TauE/SafE family protein, partial [Candidatus Eremiobacteraeota bacterium]|nr:sulfite exporter TauE/SafE family protein [Candidatus Eremiobacteraeota bacterium]
FFGIGGGIIFVMVFIATFRMPPHVVTATSTLAILLTSPAGVIAHAYARDIDWAFALPLAGGGLIGGQIGPRIARRLSSPRLLTVLAGTVLLAALALIVKHLPLHV